MGHHEQAFEKQVTQTLRDLETDRPRAAADLLPLVYTELRTLARARLANLGRGQTLEATDLVHEVWLRLVAQGDPGWKGRAHFFGAAARAMRNIMVEQARSLSSLKREASRKEELQEDPPRIVSEIPIEDVLSLNDALTRFEAVHERPARVLSLRFFTGLSIAEAAEVVGISTATAERDWRFARSWLQREMGAD